jgi:hypothetical protein
MAATRERATFFARLLIVLVTADFNPSTCEPPSIVLMPLANPIRLSQPVRDGGCFGLQTKAAKLTDR